MSASEPTQKAAPNLTIHGTASIKIAQKQQNLILRNRSPQELNLLLDFLQEAVQDPLIFRVVGALDTSAEIAGLKLKPLDLGDHIGFRIVNHAHKQDSSVLHTANNTPVILTGQYGLK